MTKITVKQLSTSNTMPMITGTVEFERFDTLRKPKHTINVYVNYNKYTLFDGNLGLDESVKPNIWKLHFSSPLYPGTYDVEAQVVDVTTNTVVVSDNTINELTITSPPVITYSRPSADPLTILGKLALVNGLMAGLGKLFGGQNGIGQNPSVHPAQDDQASTALHGRGANERDNDARERDRNKRKMTVPYPVPRPEEFKSTKPSGAAAALAKAQEIGGTGVEAGFEGTGEFNKQMEGGARLDSTVDPGDAEWNNKIDEAQFALAEAQEKTNAMNNTYNEAVQSAGGDETKAMLALEPDSQAGVDAWVPNMNSVKAAVENTNG